jgi:hypothetical protein
MWENAHRVLQGARRSVSRVLSRPKAGMAIHLGRSSPNASRDRPERRRGRPARQPRLTPSLPAAPTWSCSRWGLPCRPRYRRRGALLPHHFTLTARRFVISEPGRARRCVSVALSLRSPPPGVTRHRASVEPGLSSPCNMQRAAIRPSGMGSCGMAEPRCQRRHQNPRGAIASVRFSTGLKTTAGTRRRSSQS